MHDLFGNKTTNPNSTLESLQAGDHLYEDCGQIGLLDTDREVDRQERHPYSHGRQGPLLLPVGV